MILKYAAIFLAITFSAQGMNEEDGGIKKPLTERTFVDIEAGRQSTKNINGTLYPLSEIHEREGERTLYIYQAPAEPEAVKFVKGVFKCQSWRDVCKKCVVVFVVVGAGLTYDFLSTVIKNFVDSVST